ncbi:thioesterase II family protein [Streptomyces sp. KL116D]|uniref:thioesterase II family protein n=1 Tax=Streptomyces sp. KL116D TaxID=3045152 RepID=UPI003558F127
MNALRVWSKADEVRMWLLCLPPGAVTRGGSREWAGRLPESIGVAALELPGRGGRREANRGPRAPRRVVDEYADAVTPLLERPVMLYGRSMGRSSPSTWPTAARPARRRAARARRRRRRTARAADRADQVRRHRRRTGAVAARLGGTPEELLGCPEYLAQLLPVLRADLGLLERRPRRALPPLGCPVHVYLGVRDPMVDGPGAQRGWAAHTTREQPPRTFPGGHFFVSEIHRTGPGGTLAGRRGRGGRRPPPAAPVSRARTTDVPVHTADARRRDRREEQAWARRIRPST